MTRILVLAERPFRGLRSRAIMAEVAAALRAEPPPFLAMHVAAEVPGFATAENEPDPAALGIGRVVLAGVFTRRAELERALRVAARARAQARGATVETLCFSVEREAARTDAPEGVGVLDSATPLDLREHVTANALLVWRVAAAQRIRPFPERAVAPDPALAGALPDGKLLGLAILGGEETARAIAERGAAMAALLAPFRGWPVLPLPVEQPEGPADDLPATLDLAARFLPGSPVLLPELGETRWRRRHLTPARLKALVARCASVVATQDLPLAYAVASGVPAIGIALGQDRRAASCLSSLANELPAGSDLVFPQRDQLSRESSSARA
ncbi:hypothetical protein DFH01_05810 [Falsiroseomonas bella]|uniref:Uncharacterized protein n=1 Tax=Falsiroseomonas bella TaxID=2184016 RepID=A0A317FMC5_9PROT|nr:hypothetical protein [Falsiroseomonas bella]PWS38766.1 hypothetical protein DFH01_05810 [Falsiroseomonas bella]